MSPVIGTYGSSGQVIKRKGRTGIAIESGMKSIGTIKPQAALPNLHIWGEKQLQEHAKIHPKKEVDYMRQLMLMWATFWEARQKAMNKRYP